jgi:hypothetical protein
VHVGRATIISVRDPFSEETAADGWLARAGDAELTWGLSLLGELLHAHRIATSDPWLAPPTRERLIAARAGFGVGEEVADGRWRAARELAVAGAAGRTRRRRRSIGDSEARLARLLARSEQPLVCEDLALRARLDLDNGRPREAALQLLVALDAAIAELSSGLAVVGEDEERRGSTGPQERVAALRGRRTSTAAAAQAALGGIPSASARAEVAQTLGMLEAALRARRATA